MSDNTKRAKGMADYFGLATNPNAIGYIAEYLNAAEQRGRAEALEQAAQVAIHKGIGNGHLETCAWIADHIRALATNRI